MKFLFLLSLFLSAQNFNSVDDIENRIKKDLFFRGIVADNLIETKKYREITNRNFSSYADLRNYLILWISKNPEKASKLFSDIVTTQKSYSVYSFTYDYKIHPRFKEIIDKMKEAAKSEDISDEERRIFSSYLFEGRGFAESGLNIPFDAEKIFKKPSEKLKFNYVNINTNMLNQYISSINSLYEEFEKTRLTQDSTVQSIKKDYVDFLKFISRIKGNKRISESAGEKLIEKINLVNKDLAVYYLIVKFYNSLNLYYQGKKIHDHRILSDIQKLYEDRDLISKEEFLKRFNEINLKIDETKLVEAFRKELIIFRQHLERDYFSCWLDYLFYLIHKYVYKTSTFLSIERKQLSVKLEIDKVKSKIESKGLNLNDKDINEINNLFKNIEEINSFIKNISQTNKKLNAYFSAGFMPFGFSSKNKGVDINLYYLY